MYLDGGGWAFSFSIHFFPVPMLFLPGKDGGEGPAVFPPAITYFFYKMNERPDRRERKFSPPALPFIVPSLFDGSRLGGNWGRKRIKEAQGKDGRGLIIFLPLGFFFLFFFVGYVFLPPHILFM